MSLQEDFEAFRELALEEQDRINWEGEPYDVQDTYQTLDPLLESLVDSRQISLSGTVWVPVLDESGDVIDAAIATEPVEGISNGIFVRKEIDEINGIGLTRAVIGYWAYTGTYEENDCLYIKSTKLMAFAPVESSYCSIPEANIPDVHTLLPDGNDEVAQAIDETVLNSPMNFSRLGEIFSQFPYDSIMQVEFYLNYLNHILSPDKISATMLSDSVLVLDTADGNVTELLDAHQQLEYEGDIIGIQCVIIDDEIVMCIEIVNDDNYDEMLTMVPIRSLVSCKLSIANVGV